MYPNSCRRTLLIGTVLAVLAWAPAGLFGQGGQPVPPRDTGTAAGQKTPAGKGAITGTVAVAGTGQPARHARVTISGGELRGSRSTTTDEQGRYAFANLPAGRYSLNVSKPGHVTVSFGQHRPGQGRPGTPIQLADGQRFEAKLQIPRGGVITGAVLDEAGESTPGTQVRVMRYVMQNGVRTLQQAGSGATDDRGIYRVYGLQPGDYVVCATPRSSIVSINRMQIEAQAMREVGRLNPAQAQAMMDRAAALLNQVPTQEDQSSGYAPVCYPGTTTTANAAAVPLAVSEERTGIDFQLQLVPVARIEGVVINPVGPAVQGVQVTLVPAGQEGGIDTRRARPDGNGRFSIANVPPGQYTLVARGNLAGEQRVTVTTAGGRGVPVPPRPPAPARVWAMTDVSVDGRNLTDVVLALQPGMSVSGQITFEGTTVQPPADLTRVRITLSAVAAGAAQRQMGGPGPVSVDASGRFTIQSVLPGQYRFSASGAGAGWFIESATVAGQDTLDFPLEIKPNQNVSSAVITFTDRQTELTGTIVDEKNQPAPVYTIVAYASDPRYWTPQSRRIQTVRPGTDGRFALRNLPPGDYRLAAIVDPEPGAWYDPGFLQQLDAASLRVTLTPGEKKAQNLRMSGG
jgi:protocatechuate 3,4-dioxygenase beta subunit